jgi:RNA polymerase sigma-32 factor
MSTALVIHPTIVTPSSQAVIARDPWSLAAGPIGNLDAFIQAVNRIPMLSAEEEISLAERLQKQNDLEAARRLVMSHLRLVIAVARQFTGYGLPQADLIQEGNVGLMKAVKRFDPSRGVRLVSFAMHWIKAEIYEYVLKNWRMVKIATTKAQRKLFFNLNSFKRNGQTFSREQIEDVAKALNVRPEDVSEMEHRMAGHDLSIDPMVDDSEDSYSPLKHLAADGAEPVEVLETRRLAHLHGPALSNALAQLDERSQRILTSRWLAGESEAKTLHDLATELGISAERVRQVEQQAMKKLRVLLSSSS